MWAASVVLVLKSDLRLNVLSFKLTRHNLLLVLRCQNTTIVKFKVLTAASMKMIVFRNIAPCSLGDTGRDFRGAYCLHHYINRSDEIGLCN
jgi:hypothetical protein